MGKSMRSSSRSSLRVSERPDRDRASRAEKRSVASDQQKDEEAATRIQAVWKGKQVRKEIKRSNSRMYRVKYTKKENSSTRQKALAGWNKDQKQLPPKVLQKLHDIFNSVDTNRSGVVTKVELHQASEEFHEIDGFLFGDNDHNQSLSWIEFQQYYIRHPDSLEKLLEQWNFEPDRIVSPRGKTVVSPHLSPRGKSGLFRLESQKSPAQKKSIPESEIA